MQPWKNTAKKKNTQITSGNKDRLENCLYNTMKLMREKKTKNGTHFINYSRRKSGEKQFTSRHYWLEQSLDIYSLPYGFIYSFKFSVIKICYCLISRESIFKKQDFNMEND